MIAAQKSSRKDHQLYLFVGCDPVLIACFGIKEGGGLARKSQCLLVLGERLVMGEYWWSHGAARATGWLAARPAKSNRPRG
jgi:hypothetical protein